MDEFVESRPLSVDEREIIAKEFAAQARARGVFGTLFVLMALGAATFTVWKFAALSLESSALFALTGLFLGGLGVLLLIGGRRHGIAVPHDFEATRRMAHCETRVHGSGKHQRMRYYVGSYLVYLRSGWQEFWPEGREVEVELCFPPEQIRGVWFDAAVVSLPGINVGQMRRIPPPSTLGGWGLFCGLMFLATIFVVTWSGYSGPRAPFGSALVALTVLVFLGVVLRNWVALRRYKLNLAAWKAAILEDTERAAAFKPSRSTAQHPR